MSTNARAAVALASQRSPDAPPAAPLTLALAQLESWEPFFTRLVFAGLDWGDITRALAERAPAAAGPAPVTPWRFWHDRWRALAEAYGEAAETALKAGRTLTAGPWFERAAAAAHFAEFMLFSEPDVKRATRAFVTELYRKALPLLAHPVEGLVIPHLTQGLPAFVHRPACAGPHPCVILVNGLDSAKEVELHVFARAFVERGVAAVVFDAPGQGELLGDEALPIAFEDVVASVLRRMRSCADLDMSRVGIFGVSYGGYLAARAAALHPSSIRACISLAGTFDLDHYSRINPRVREDFRFVFRQQDDDAMSALTSRLSLAGLPHPTCPFLCIHGGLDQVFPFDACRKFESWARGPFELIAYPHEKHVCTNYFSDYIPRFADWMQGALATSASASTSAQAEASRESAARAGALA